MISLRLGSLQTAHLSIAHFRCQESMMVILTLESYIVEIQVPARTVLSPETQSPLPIFYSFWQNSVSYKFQRLPSGPRHVSFTLRIWQLLHFQAR